MATTFLGHKNPHSVFPNFQDQTTRIFMYEVLNPSEDGINIHRQPCEFWCYRQEQKEIQHMIWLDGVCNCIVCFILKWLYNYIKYLRYWPSVF